MPAIYLFQRKTLSGGDDVQLVCLFSMVVKILEGIGVWLLWSRIVACMVIPDLYLHAAWITYLVSSVLVATLGFGLEVRLYQVSSQGTPTEREPRSQKVQKLLEFKLLHLMICQVLVVVCGIICADLQQKQDGQHGSTRFWIVFGLLMFLQLTEVLASITMIVRLLHLPRSTERTIMTTTTTSLLYHYELAEEMWVERCTNLCTCLGSSTCFFFGGREVALGDYGDIARALADYFETGGVLDLVPSDIVAGFLVLQRIQRQRVLEARHEVVSQRGGLPSTGSLLESTATTMTSASSRENSQASLLFLPLGGASDDLGGSDNVFINNSRRHTTYLMHQLGSQTFYEAQSRKVLHRNNILDVQTLREGAHFAKYALAIYTWVLYVYNYPFTGIPRLLCHSRACCLWKRRDDESDRFIGDNCCQIHKTALLLHAGLEDEADLVYVQLRSSLTQIPYCIILDHKWQTVVLAIRGTFSLEDCVTDVLIDPEPLDRLGQEFGFAGDDQHCHGGVLSCARIVYRDLQRHGILSDLLVGNQAKYPNYTLRIVGHSLGAATATVLAYMMRQTFPTLQCLNFSPPGCSLTWDLATDCQEFCTSFVLDSDLVPRLSLDSMDHLRDEVLGLIGRIKIPKIEVANHLMIGTGLLSCRFFRDGDLEKDGPALRKSIQEMLYDKEDVPPDSEYQQQLRQFQAIQSERKSRRQRRAIKLFPPGRIVHLMKTGEHISCCHGIVKCVTCCTTNLGSEYTPVWLNNDDLNEIVVTPTMGTDHFPNRLCSEMEGVARAYGIDSTVNSTYPVEIEPIERE